MACFWSNFQYNLQFRQNRKAMIAEAVHPLLNKKMLAPPGGKILLSTMRSK